MGNWAIRVSLVNIILIGSIISLTTACVATEDLILPNKHQRISLVESYKQCVAAATNNRMYQNRDPEAIVRDSMNHCRTTKYAMLKDYPKGWRDNYEKQIDEEVLREEIAYVVKTRNER